jgi:RNA polymerase sigma-70 factor (ECF subfamily)
LEDELQRQLPALLPRLWRFALRLTRHTADAEDLVQRSCLRALERRNQWQPGTVLLSWMFAIMHSIWLNELRSAQRRRESRIDWEDESAQPAAPLSEGDPEHALMCRQILLAVHDLPEAQRVVMLLVGGEGLSYREAAEVLEIPIGTVMSRLSRARMAIGQRFLVNAAAAKGAAEGSK